MIYAGLFLVVFFLYLLLRLGWAAAGIMLLLLLALLPAHRKKFRQARDQDRRFAELSLYMDTLLYAFLKTGKIDGAMADTVEALPEGELKETAGRALDHMRLTFDDSDILRDGLALVEERYRCRRLSNIHRFMTHVEYYGGSTEHSVRLFLKDKAGWEKRIRDTMADRKKMFSEIVFSVVVSLVICGIIVHFPVMELDISEQPLTQILAVAVVLLDDLIIQRGQRLLAPDWLVLEEEGDDGLYERKMEEFGRYDEAREHRLSLLLGGLGAILTLLAFWFWGQWAGLAGVVLTVIFFNQHRIGRYMARRTLEKGIICAFPVWLMDLVLLLQSENVQVALQKSLAGVPGVLRGELRALTERLEVNPESGEPYHRFLREFHMPEVSSAMSMLYALSMGTGGEAGAQLEELVDRNMRMMDRAQEIRLKEKSGRMYGLFLAPVLTASLKLFVDMGLIMLSFLSSANIG